MRETRALGLLIGNICRVVQRDFSNAQLYTVKYLAQMSFVKVFARINVKFYFTNSRIVNLGRIIDAYL